VDEATTAFSELEDVIESRGKRDPHPFHVYGSQGLAWLKRAPLARRNKVEGMERLREVVSTGLELHPARQDLKRLSRDLQQEYLMLATEQPTVE